MYNGHVKSMGGSYGFISCPDTHAVYNRDVFIQKMKLTEPQWHALQTGHGVSFDVTLDDKNQPQAVNITVTSQGDASAAGKKGGGKGKDWGKGPSYDPFGYGAWDGSGYGMGAPKGPMVSLEGAQVVALQGETGYFIPMTAVHAQLASQNGGGGGKKRPFSDMDGGKGDKGGGKSAPKFPRPSPSHTPNPGLDPEQQTFFGIMKGRLNPATGFTFIHSDDVAVLYPGKDVFVHSKMCPWVESMTLEKDMMVQFQYVEKDGSPQATRVIVVDGSAASTTTGAFTSFSAPLPGSA
jgi:cold shock CspA family protein